MAYKSRLINVILILSLDSSLNHAIRVCNFKHIVTIFSIPFTENICSKNFSYLGFISL